MTCRVEVMAPDGSFTQARALLDSPVSTLLITKRLAKNMHLPRRRNNFKTNGVVGFNVHPRRTVSFRVAGVGGGGGRGGGGG